jgi:hypothetical protein
MVQSQGKVVPPQEDDPIGRMLKDPAAQVALTKLRDDGFDLTGRTKAAHVVRMLLLAFAVSDPDEESTRDLVWRIQKIVKWATRSSRTTHDDAVSHLLFVVRAAAKQPDYTIDASALKQRRWRRRNPATPHDKPPESIAD